MSGVLALALLGVGGEASAQTTYPTAAGATVKVPGVVPLQCNASGAACAPVTASNPAGPSQVVGTVAHDAVDSGNPVKVGCIADPGRAAVASLDRVDVSCTAIGAVMVSVDYAGGFGADGVASAFFPYRSQPSQGGGSNLPVLVANYGFNGTSWDRARGDTNGLVVLPGLSSTYWSYSNGAAGILSNTTTAVTMKAAAGAGVRNFIDSCTINTTAFGTAVPLAIRDGAGGTVIFALNVPTAGFLQPINVQFEMPLRGTANTLLEVVTTTANTSGTVWVNCQGHTGS